MNCNEEGCLRKYYAKGYCKLHYQHVKKYGKTYPEPIYKRSSGKCFVKECGRKHQAKGYCERHYKQMSVFGEIKGHPSKTKFDRNDYEECIDGCRVILCDNTRNYKGFTVIDTVDLDNVLKKKWHLSTVGYAVSDDGKTQLSAFILGHKQSNLTLVDHINRDKLDNRRSNLRIANKSINSFNSKIRSDNTSGQRGVSWEKERKQWIAQICSMGKVRHIGRFDSKEDAINARRNIENTLINGSCF